MDKTTGLAIDLPMKRTPSLLLLDVEATHLDDVFEAAVVGLVKAERVSAADAENIRSLLARRLDGGPEQVEHGVAIVHAQGSAGCRQTRVLLRLAQPIVFHDYDDEPVSFVWVLLSDQVTHPHIDIAATFVQMMHDAAFRSAAFEAKTDVALHKVFDDAVKSPVGPLHEVPPELRPTGEWFGAFRADIARRLPHYGSDFTDGLNSKTVASVFFLFFACLAPAVAFGGLLAVLTDGQIGVIEMILATTICGVIYAFTSGQPLTILGSTGPVIIFMGILYSLTSSWGLPYLATLSWVGFWTMIFLLIIAAADGCAAIRYFTRFTDETFAALISLIFIAEAVKDLVHVFTDPDASSATALASLVLALGTYQLAMGLARLRSSTYLRRQYREFLADFGPSIAIVLMSVAGAYVLSDVPLETLAVPDVFQPSTERSWFVDPFEAPTWVRGASMVPALLVSILLYLDQNITVRLVNNPSYKLTKGAGYHLDLAIVALLVGVCSILGLPWMVAATVRSLNHVRALAEVETVAIPHGPPEERIVSVVETRLSGVLVHAAVGVSLLLLPLLKLVPMSVLFGLFLFMGVSAMRGNQFFERLRLGVTDPQLYPPVHYLRAVPTRVVHRFTAIQAVCLGVLWIVKTSAVGILFPLFIALLVPIRFLMDRFFDPVHLALLDAEEEPEEEEYRSMD